MRMALRITLVCAGLALTASPSMAFWRHRPTVVVNVGAADGYYAVGLARRLPHARVLAYEPNEERLAQLVAIAELNGVAARVEAVSEAARHESLEEVLDVPAAVVCDCDGCEAELLDPRHVTRLRHATLIVEAHDLLVPGITDTLRQAFEGSHDIVQIDADLPRRMDIDGPQCE